MKNHFCRGKDICLADYIYLFKVAGPCSYRAFEPVNMLWWRDFSSSGGGRLGNWTTEKQVAIKVKPDIQCIWFGDGDWLGQDFVLTSPVLLHCSLPRKGFAVKERKNKGFSVKNGCPLRIWN
jgi:hypothetical protein